MLVRVTVALFTLYVAASLFGIAGGVADFAVSGMSRSAVVVIEAGLAFVWG
jgi:hypothetical protein